MATGVSKKIPTKKGFKYTIEYPNKVPIQKVLNGFRPDLQSYLVKDATNKIIFGENLEVLRTLLGHSNVRLIYIDPPYGTGFDFESRDQTLAYNDHLTGGGYLEFIRQRLILLREVLSDDGSIYVHLDSKMIFPVKVLMDEIFGEENFRSCITRQKTNSKNYTRNTFGNISDYILFYTKTNNYVWNQQFETLSEKLQANEYRHVEEKTGRRFMSVPVHAPGVRNGATGGKWKNMTPPPGKHWQYTPKKLEELDKKGEIYWSSTGNPRRKVFLDEHKGVGVQDIWLGFKDAHNQNIQITGYPTEKNPDLIKRIILASSNPGDTVLDSFGGSGTVAEVAGQTGRNWITIDNSLEAIKTTLNRLINGRERMGDYVQKQNSKQKKLAFSPVVNFDFLADKRIEKEKMDSIKKILKQLGLTK